MTAPALPLEATVEPLAPVRIVLEAMAGRADLPPLTGLAPGLTVDPATGWTPATALVCGEAVDNLLETAQQRWRASPHAAAALAWKCYAYWLALPAVLGYAAARRVPLMQPESVMASWSPRQPFIRVGVTSVEVAVLPSDPLAAMTPTERRANGVRVVADEDALCAQMRESLVAQHLALVLEQVRARARVGRRTLWGSLAAGVAHGLSRAADVLPGPVLDTAWRILTSLGVADLVELAPRDDGSPRLEVRRRTCCLAFTLPKPKICTGCCIR